LTSKTTITLNSDIPENQLKLFDTVKEKLIEFIEYLFKAFNFNTAVEIIGQILVIYVDILGPIQVTHILGNGRIITLIIDSPTKT